MFEISFLRGIFLVLEGHLNVRSERLFPELPVLPPVLRDQFLFVVSVWILGREYCVALATISVLEGHLMRHVCFCVSLAN